MHINIFYFFGITNDIINYAHKLSVEIPNYTESFSVLFQSTHLFQVTTKLMLEAIIQQELARINDCNICNILLNILAK